LEQLTYIRIHARELAHDDVDEVLEPSREIRPSVFQLRTERSKTCEQTFYDVDTKPLEQLGRTVYFVLSSRRIIRNTEDFSERFDGVGHFTVNTENHAVHQVNAETVEQSHDNVILLTKRDLRAILQRSNQITRFGFNLNRTIRYTRGNHTTHVITKVFKNYPRFGATESILKSIENLRLNIVRKQIPTREVEHFGYVQGNIVILTKGFFDSLFDTLCNAIRPFGCILRSHISEQAVHHITRKISKRSLLDDLIHCTTENILESRKHLGLTRCGCFINCRRNRSENIPILNLLIHGIKSFLRLRGIYGIADGIVVELRLFQTCGISHSVSVGLLFKLSIGFGKFIHHTLIGLQDTRETVLRQIGEQNVHTCTKLTADLTVRNCRFDSVEPTAQLSHHVLFVIRQTIHNALTDILTQLLTNGGSRLVEDFRRKTDALYKGCRKVYTFRSLGRNEGDCKLDGCLLSVDKALERSDDTVFTRKLIQHTRESTVRIIHYHAKIDLVQIGFKRDHLFVQVLLCGIFVFDGRSDHADIRCHIELEQPLGGFLNISRSQRDLTPRNSHTQDILLQGDTNQGSNSTQGDTNDCTNSKSRTETHTQTNCN